MAAEKTSPRDNMLWAVSLLILLAGVVGFFHFADEVMTLIRAVGLLVALVIALIVANKTARGRMMFSFMRETDVERRKVVWPNRQETFQTTLMVLVLTLIAAVLLFLMDTLFGWIIRRLIGAAGGT